MLFSYVGGAGTSSPVVELIPTFISSHTFPKGRHARMRIGRSGYSALVTINNVMQAALYALTTITSVSALAVALFGSAAALERWLDSPRLKPAPPEVVEIARNPDRPLFDPDAHTQAA
jgi:hypothetical protein